MSVAKMKDGKRWYASARYKDWTGATKQKKKEGFQTKREAQEWERAFIEKQTGSPDMTVKALYEIYMESCKARLKPTTYANKAFLFDSHVIPYLGARQAASVTAADIRRWQDTLLTKTQPDGSKYSQTYLKTINNQVSALFNFGVRYYGMKQNPCRTAGSMGKKNADSMQFWTVDEFCKFIVAVSDHPQSVVMFSVLFWTGIRLGELLALTPTDFDFEKLTLRINKNFAHVEGRDLIMEPKTPKSRRIIDISQALADMVKSYISVQYGIAPTDRLFPERSTKSSLRREMIRGADAAGVKRIRVHDLRHSHASLLIEMGYSPIMIAERLGHENIETTLQTYSHLYPNKQGEAAQKMNSKIKSYDFVTHSFS